MIKRILILSLYAGILSGCSMKQVLHPFPKELETIILNEKCDCDKIEIIESNSKPEYISGTVPREKTWGYILREDGIRKPYSISKSAIYVNEGFDLSYIENTLGETIDFITSHETNFSNKQSTLKNVEQSIQLTNPFDNMVYTIIAKYNGESIQLFIESTHEDKKIIGELSSTDSGLINKTLYHLQLKGQWKQKTEKEVIRDQNILHQYSDGSYIIISNKNNDEIKIFQGATTGKTLGQDSFTGYQSTVFIPKNITPKTIRDMFIFYYSSEFSEDFMDNIQTLPYCLKSPENQSAAGCPSNIVIK